MNYKISYLPEAWAELKALDGSVRSQVVSGIRKVSRNPLSVYDGGYGKPLGSKAGTDLSGLMKIKFRKIGIRVVYKVKTDEDKMKIIIISARADDQVYIEAENRRKKYDI